ncbi:hypothetical protein DKM44_03960 [Deinococcus irradiatisoli]|uniref:Probable beta-carotene 15,15'-dioxygenase n=1 Tax=Deinococcus irradiatisoli TaxID=2202254 RepID=A0A2Z3JC05_9DEIO|nr:Brp/Blh family beta-carotene 15,15'-dioxygenase [Deinococcus irradiatisoli]AWN22495.1 hypothetical protein DKM44_03960 [Deinococcus irradiatisoli]
MPSSDVQVLPTRLNFSRRPAAARVLSFVPVLSLLLLLLAWLVVPAALERLMYLPLLISTVLLGIPHGALDHQVPARLGWRWGRRPWVGLYLLGYLLLAAGVLLCWLRFPDATFWGFLLMSLLHWGQGDVHHLERVQGRRRAARWSALLAVLARGSLPILVPLLRFPDWFARLSAGIHQVFHLPSPGGALLPPPWPMLLGAGVALLLAAYVADTLRSSRRPRLELAETGVLLLTFLVVPTPLAIGIYFSLWHAWRHLDRLLNLRVYTEQAPPRRTWHLALDLLPISVIALGLLSALYFWARPHVQTQETFAALYLALIAALTLPHALLVAVMDENPAPARQA